MDDWIWDMLNSFFVHVLMWVSDEFYWDKKFFHPGVLRGLHRIHHGQATVTPVGPAPCFFVGQTGDFWQQSLRNYQSFKVPRNTSITSIAACFYDVFHGVNDVFSSGHFVKFHPRSREFVIRYSGQKPCWFDSCWGLCTSIFSWAKNVIQHVHRPKCTHPTFRDFSVVIPIPGDFSDRYRWGNCLCNIYIYIWMLFLIRICFGKCLVPWGFN